MVLAQYWGPLVGEHFVKAPQVRVQVAPCAVSFTSIDTDAAPTAFVSTSSVP